MLRPLHASRPDSAPPERHQRGRTLVELVVALAIGAVLVALAMPAYHHWIARQEQSNAATALLAALSLARTEAMKRGLRVDLCPSDDGAVCSATGRWENGWIVFADADRNGHRGPAEDVVRVEAAMRPGVSIRGNKPVASYVSFTDTGHARLASGALQMGSFDICRRGQSLLQVVLANGGRARLQPTATPCP